MDTTILLDHAASTPARPEVTAVFLDALDRTAGGNPMAAHGVGRAARTVLEEAREQLAVALGRSPHEVVFTSGGAEADQLAVVGAALAAIEARPLQRPHVIASAVEHPAVRDAVGWLATTHGVEVTWIAPGAPVPLAAAQVTDALRDDTVLVAVTAADGELGIHQPQDAADAALARGVAVHRDAVQAVATRTVPAAGSLAVSGHKLGAPAGIGAALLPRGVPVRAAVDGPGQERGLRSGTPAAALAAALARAVELAVAEAPDHARRARRLTSVLAGALADTDGVRPTLSPDDPARVPTHLHLQIDRVDGEALATALDARGVAVSTGTACATGSARRSPVLEATGVEADAVLRCSVGRTTTEAEVVEAAARIRDVVAGLRAAGGGFL